MEMTREIPAAAELLKYANVPVKLAAAYLGVTEQTVRCRIRAKGDAHWPIGYQNNKRCLIPPQMLITFKEGMEKKERIDVELRTIGKFLESGALEFEEILNLLVSKQRAG